MAITTAKAFLAVLEKSELLTAEQFSEAEDAALLTDDARALAGMLTEGSLITRWQASQLLAGRSSFFLGNYVLLELLGHGGMGRVFLARHTTMNRYVALKTISRRVGRDPASLERFLAEARSIAALDHPNIVRAYNVDNEGDRFYIVMEYIEGQDLRDMVRAGGPLDFEQAADYIRQAAEGLAHAHGRNMIHCDIKPSNLLANTQGTVKLLDMGMARLVGEEGEEQEEDDSAEAPEEEQVLGTVDFLAPEQAVQGPNFDHRADIYSLGCTFYFLLTGRPPFGEGTLAQRILKHQTKQPPSILDQRPDTPKDLVAICMKMMAKDPKDRFQSVDEISKLLTGWRMPAPEPGADKTPGARSAAGSTTAAAPPSLLLDELEGPVPTATTPIGRSQGSLLGDNPSAVLWVAMAVFVFVGLLVLTIVFLAVGTPESGDGTAARTGSVEQGPTIQDPTTQDPTTIEPSAQPAAAPPSKPENGEEDPFAWDNDNDQPVKQPGEPPAAQTPSTQPEPTQPEPTQPGPTQEDPEQKDPLSELASATSLPKLIGNQRRQPVVLAEISVEADAAWDLALEGGQTALKDGGRFLMTHNGSAEVKNRWLIQLERTAPQRQPSRTDVAHIWLNGNALTFKWLDRATVPAANHLRNCLLKVTLNGKTRSLALVEPRIEKPIVIDLNDGVMKKSIPTEYLPRTSSMRLMITAMEGPSSTSTWAEATCPKWCCGSSTRPRGSCPRSR
jgi:serine/threonine protein kinase